MPSSAARVAAALTSIALPLVTVAIIAGRGADDVSAREVSKEAGIHEVTHTWGATVGDFDNDGWDDVLIAPHKRSSPPPRLYRNVGGRFERVPATKLPAQKSDRHDCDWGDVDRDNLPDLYCSVGGGRGTKRNGNELWMQQPDGSFVDKAGVYGVRDFDGRGRDVAFFDANGDDLTDLFVANAYPRYDGRRSENKLFLNVDGRSFREAPEYGLNRQVGGHEVHAVDYDADGWKDLVLCGQERLHLYENRRGQRFRDVSHRAGSERTCRSVALANIDGDRRQDLVRISRSRLVVSLQSRNGSFDRTVYRRKIFNGGDIAVGRVNGDARDDLYVLQRGPIGEDRDDLVLLNERDGRGFREAPIPQTKRGKAESVMAIDHDRNGRADFIVMNGKNKARGPIRLIAFGE